MSRYAQNTGVSVNRSKAEIERILERYGTSEFISGWNDDAAMIGFRMNNRLVRFHLSMPSKDDPEIKTTPTGRYKKTEAINAAWEQARRQRWRALALVIKAKLEAVESGITDFESEFMAHILLPDGRNVREWLLPQLDSIYTSRKMPVLLPGITGGGEDGTKSSN